MFFLLILFLLVLVLKIIKHVMYFFSRSEFHVQLWNDFIEYRYLYVNDLIKTQVLLNKSKVEVRDFLGDEFNDPNSDQWVYYIGKRFRFEKKSQLYVLFDDEDKVFKVIKF